MLVGCLNCFVCMYVCCNLINYVYKIGLWIEEEQKVFEDGVKEYGFVWFKIVKKIN